MPQPAAAAATTTQRQSGERHHHHHHHLHHRRREDAAWRQQEDPQREEQQDREAAEESARQGPISMTDFEKRCETIKIGANEALLWMSDYRKLDPRRKKRRLGGLLTELQEKKGELTDQYMALADLDEDTWEDKRTGEKHSAMVIVLDAIEYSGGSRKKDPEAPQAEPAEEPPQSKESSFTGYQGFGGANSFFDDED